MLIACGYMRQPVDAKMNVLLQTILFIVEIFQDDVFLEYDILKPRRIVANPICDTLQILL
jgi:hypothetical protein